jgi:multidrug resistance efflux pump
MIPEADWPERKKSDPTLYQANAERIAATNELAITRAKYEELQTIDPEVKVREAEAAVKQAEAEQAKAKAVVDLCVVQAKMPGTIEQITIGPGTTMGVGTRIPALWLIPTGPRVVRAEVEAEFAHRVGPDIHGKTVTISDHTDPKLTYSGVVRRIPPVFMLKRGNTENFLGGDTRVLEAVIDVSDPAPAGKPPLRVGQRVRVNLGP